MECCLPEGEATLTCADTYSDGWAYGGFNGYVMIGETQYCADFTTGASMTVTVMISEAEDTDAPTDSECVDVSITVVPDNYPQEMSWFITEECGQARGSVAAEATTITCCLEVGDYTVSCEDEYGDGWFHQDVQGRLEIDGVSYCEEFTTAALYTAALTVEVPTDMPTETTMAPTEPTDTAEPEPTSDECDGVLVEIMLTPDQYPDEMSWSVNEECAGARDPVT